jgi:hypothetical protein
MKLYIEDDNGNRTELKELPELSSNSNILLFKMNNQLTRENYIHLTESLEMATGKRCIVLDKSFDKVYGIS